MLDLTLAIAHHVLIFALFGVLVVELASVKKGMGQSAITQVAAVDLWYGILAALILAVGLIRAYYSAKGWAYYSHNTFFWAKLGVFLLIGLLSVPPTIFFIKTRRAEAIPTDAEISRVRMFLHLEAVLFLLLPGFAAAMARGYGAF
jgi:putative membrane protein